MKARIFLTITDILKIVDYTGLSMRLPPRAAKPKPLCCFSIDGKRKKAAIQPPSGKRYFVTRKNGTVDSGFFYLPLGSTFSSLYA